MNFVKVLLIFFLYTISLINVSYAMYVEHDVDENIEITQLLDGRKSLFVQGNIEIGNPSSTSKIYEYRLNTNLPSGVFGNFNSVNSNAQIVGNRFYGYEFNPNSSLEFSYSFSGIVNDSLVNTLNNSNVSFLELYSLPQYTLKPSINVDKPIMESEAQSVVNQSTGEIKRINSTSTEPRRVVSSRVSNPSEFFVIGKEIEILRTSTQDTFMESSVSLGKQENFTIDPLDYKQFDFIDTNSSILNSTENKSMSYSPIYWVQSKISAAWNWNSTISYDFKVQQIPSNSGGGGSSSPPSNIGEDDSEEVVRDNLIIKKEVDKLFVTKGEELEVTIKVMNLGSNRLEDISFSDIIPDGYSLKSVSGANINGKTLEFSVESLDAFSETELKYTLIKEEVDRSFTYLPPVNYQGDAILEGALIVEELLGDARLFVQKEVDWVDSEFSRVKITIRNVGDSRITNFRLFDEINERYRMREISQPFFENNRGMWEIKSLAPNSNWEVEYLVENHNSVSELPILLGIDESQVYGTVIINSHVSSMINQESSWFETIGIIMAGLILLAYIVF